MKYPTLEEVENADHEQICRWMRFLKVSGNPEEQKVIVRLCERCDEFGGFTTAISKKIGWKQ